MKSKKPLVSVIIPTKNNIRTIERCLQSVKDQTYKNIELIVVDNHSTDGTLEIAKKFTNKVYTKGPERSAQRNFGARRASGQYLLIHDSDIYFNKNTVKECVKECKNNGSEAVIIPEKSIGIGYWAKVKAFERDFYIGNNIIEAPRFFSTNTYKKERGYDESLTGPEDWELMVRLRGKNAIINRSKSFAIHDEGQVKIFGSSQKKSYYRDSVEKYKKMYPEWSKQQLNPFVRFPIKILMISLIKNPMLTFSLLFMKSIELFYSNRKL